MLLLEQGGERCELKKVLKSNQQMGWAMSRLEVKEPIRIDLSSDATHIRQPFSSQRKLLSYAVTYSGTFWTKLWPLVLDISKPVVTEISV